MKKGLSLILLFLFLFPTLASAHTKLVSSNPSEGQVVTEQLNQITLEFEESLEPLSTLKLYREGSTIAVTNVMVENNKLVANVPNGLENGNYKIEWKVLSEDGHPVTGQIPFKVQLKEIENKTTTNDNKTSDKTVKDQTSSSEKQKEAAPKKEKSKYLIPLLAIGLFGIALMVGGVMLWNRK